MSQVTRRALRVYSSLSELKGQGDVLDALIPFFEPILSLTHQKIFDPRVFAAGVRKLYGWRFTEDIAMQFIPRLHAKGFLQRNGMRAETIYVVNFPPTADLEAEPSIVTAVERIIDEFQKFPPRITDLLSYSRTRDQLKDILIRFLVSMDSYGQGAYAPELGGLEPGGQAREILASLEEGGRPLDPNDRYMCARFVQHLMATRPEFVPTLTRLASIALLTEVVEDFLKPVTAEETSDLTVILDAPLALDLLGCSGKNLKDDIRAITDSLKTIGTKFIVLPISCVEIQRNLSSMLSLPESNRRGYTHHALIQKEVREDFVVAVSNNAESALTNIGITVRPIDLHSFPHAHRLFTHDQYEDFFSSITWVSQVDPREHDATCVALVMRLREGRQSSDVFKSRYVLATRNPRFVRDSRNYCIASRMLTKIQAGPVIHQRELATLAWLRTGLGADDNVPRGHLIATCDRVLRVRPEVRQALAQQLEKLTPDRLEQFNTLMLDSRSVQALADQTLNDEKVVTSENAQRLLNVIREATASNLKEIHEKELQAQREQALEKEESAAKRLSETEAELAAHKQTVEGLKERNARNIDGLATKTNHSVTVLDRIATGLLLVLGAIGGLDHFTQIMSGYLLWSLVLLTAGAFGLYRLIWAAREKPTKGLASALNAFAACDFSRRLSGAGLSEEPERSSFEIAKGKVVRKKVV